MTSLIIGGHGYIGSVLSEKLPDSVVFEGDVRVTNWEDTLRPKYDTIYYLAAQTNAYVSNQDPIADAEVNLFPIVRMMEAIKSLQRRPSVIFTSVATAVGMTLGDTSLDYFLEFPLTAYDIHKLTVEKYLFYYQKQHGLNSIAVRFPNIYGPSPSKSKPGRGFLNLVVQSAVNGTPVTLFKGFGDHMRDYLYIDDAVDALICAAGQPEEFDGRAYVIGTGIGTTFYDVLEKTGCKFTEVDAPPDTLLIERRDFIANSYWFYRVFGWQPKVSLDEGLKRLREFYENQTL